MIVRAVGKEVVTTGRVEKVWSFVLQSVDEVSTSSFKEIIGFLSASLNYVKVLDRFN